MSNRTSGEREARRAASRTVNVGFGNFVRVDRIVAVLEAKSLPVKRLRERAGTENLLVDATAGRKMRSLIVTDSRHVVLSALSPQALEERLGPASLALSGFEERELVS